MFVLQALCIVLLPGLALLLDRRFRVARWLGPVVLCYGFGIVLANVGWTLHEPTLKTAQEATVVLAIPLLLFGTDFVAWLKLAPQTLLSFALMIVAALASAWLTYLLLGHRVEESWNIAGMLVGMYTGGTVNTIAIGTALDVKRDIFVLVTTADIILGGFWLLLLLSVAQRFFLLFLPPFPQDQREPASPSDAPSDPAVPLVSGRSQRQRLKEMGIAIGVSVVCVGLSVAGSLVLFRKVNEVFVIVALTTLGLVASFVPRIRRLAWSFEAGDTLMLMFCVAIGMQVNVQKMLQSSEQLKLFLLFTACLMFGALVIHSLLAALFRIDADTTIMTSAAGIFGPPFIGPIARALGNRQLIVSGLTMGIAGLALGTYLGILLATLLQP